MSVGALMDKQFHDKILQLAIDNDCKIHLPTGAITGIDTVNAAKMGEITEVSLTTRKPPISLGVELDGVDEKVLFEGKASEAVKLFPKNINVSSTLSLASGIDVDVKIIASAAEWSSDIDIAWAKRSEEDALKRIENSKTDEEKSRAELKLKRAQNRISVYEAHH
jgi:predicted dinucleotide-utilizing enzyme